MSNNIITLHNTGSRAVDMVVTSYYGGDHSGICVQLTALMEDGKYGYIQLSTSDIINLRSFFNSLVIKENIRKSFDDRV